jgi:diacylglycerol O-acyltransferase
VFAQRLDRTKPLWELWLVDHVHGDRFAVISKTHHCLVDGISGVDIATVLLDLAADPPPPPEPPPAWFPKPAPSAAALVADAVAERMTVPLDIARAAGEVVSNPERAAGQLGKAVAGLGAMVKAGLQGAPTSPYNTPIGPHRRFAWVDADLGQFRAIKTALGGTVNDVVLAVVAGALRAHMLANGHDVAEVELKAMVPMSVRLEAQRGALGNRVTTMYAPLPVHAGGPLERFRIVHEAMAGLKESGQAVGAETLTQLTGFAPPTVLAQAARLQSHQRLFNLTVTNVPGPQFPLFILGRRLLRIYPQVPLTRNTVLGMAIMSYDGTINFGLLADFDALPDLDDLAAALRDAIAELAAVAGVAASNGRVPGDAAERRSPVRR